MSARYTFDVIVYWSDDRCERLTHNIPPVGTEVFEHLNHKFKYIGTFEGDRIYREVEDD